MSLISDTPISDAQLAALEFGERPPIARSERWRARQDALKAIAHDLPDPRSFAWYLRKPWNEWLASAYRSQDRANAGCWRVKPEHAPDLFSMGLCDKHGYLGAFGNAVRKALLEQANG